MRVISSSIGITSGSGAAVATTSRDAVFGLKGASLVSPMTG
ncbi:MAG: hypothetical protein ACLQBD_22475 [Syntrophobacteraceae bacterium]